MKKPMINTGFIVLFCWKPLLIPRLAVTSFEFNTRILFLSVLKSSLDVFAAVTNDNDDEVLIITHPTTTATMMMMSNVCYGTQEI